MDDKENNAINFEDGDSADLYDFSWEYTTEETVHTEIADLNLAINKVSVLLRDMVIKNNYKETAREYFNLVNTRLGRNSWIQEFYYANRGDFEPYMRSNEKPKGYYDWSNEKRKAFDLGLKCQRDAAWACQPLDQMMMLMNRVPLQDAFQMAFGTILLDDTDFDEDLYGEIDDIIRDINEFFSYTWTGMENVCNLSAHRYYKENYGKISPDSLKAGYRKERLYDYNRSFSIYCRNAGKYFKCDDNCKCHCDLQFLGCMQITDEFMRTMALALRNSLDTKLEQCLTECKKLDAVLKSRCEKCETDTFKSTMQMLEDLNDAINEFCELAYNMCKNYKGRISASPYCFMKYPPACGNIKQKFGFRPINTDPLEVGSKYMLLMQYVEDAVSSQCKQYVNFYGETDFGS